MNKKEIIINGEQRFITCLQKEITDPEYRLLVSRWESPTSEQVPMPGTSSG